MYTLHTTTVVFLGGSLIMDGSDLVTVIMCQLLVLARSSCSWYNHRAVAKDKLEKMVMTLQTSDTAVCKPMSFKILCRHIFKST